MTNLLGTDPDDDLADVGLAGRTDLPTVTTEPDAGLGLFAGAGALDELWVYDAVNAGLSSVVDYDLQPAAIEAEAPLPASALLLLGGLAGLAGLRRRG